MTEHVREWKRQSDGKYWRGDGERMLAECLANEQVEARLNAAERLSAEDLFPVGFAIVHPNLDKLIAYANILEGKDA